jgi:hypothetical protein
MLPKDFKLFFVFLCRYCENIVIRFYPRLFRVIRVPLQVFRFWLYPTTLVFFVFLCLCGSKIFFAPFAALRFKGFQVFSALFHKKRAASLPLSPARM